MSQTSDALRIRFPRMGSALCGLFVLLLLSPSPAAAITCLEAVEAAIVAIPDSSAGIDWPCCSRTTASCRTDLDTCDAGGQFPDFATCFSTSGSVACQISETTSTGAPCGAFSGDAGPSGVTPVADHDFTFDGLEAVVRANWAALGVDNSRVLCCSPSSGDCHIDENEEDLVNPCNRGEYELLCAGSQTQGICSVYANVTQTRELGVYFRVNLEADTPSSGSTSTPASPTEPTEGTPSSSNGSQTSPNASAPATSESKHGPSAVVIALPIVAAALIIAVLMFFLLRRRRRRQQQVGSDATPYTASMHPLVSTTTAEHYQGTAHSSNQHFFAGESQYPTTQQSPSSMPSTQSPFSGPSSSTQPPVPRTGGKGSIPPVTPRAPSPAPPYTIE